MDPAFHGRGIGTEAVRRVVRLLIDERGHHRITIDPAAENAAAIRAYEKVGFRPVGIMRGYERDVGRRALPRRLADGPARRRGDVSVDLGKIGIWRIVRERSDVVAEIEALGFGALWVGGSPSVAQIRPFLERSQTLPIATGIVNVWKDDADDAAAQQAELERDFPGRFLLGIGIGHPEATREYDSRSRRCGLLRRAGRRAAGAARGARRRRARAEDAASSRPSARSARTRTSRRPSTRRFARESVGPDALVAPELAVVLEPDASEARASGARRTPRRYLRLRNYTTQPAALRLHRGRPRGRRQRPADRHGRPARHAEAVAGAVRAHLDAGADHVCVQPLSHGAGAGRGLPRAGRRAALTLTSRAAGAFGDMDLELSGRVAVVTGASKGIGLAITRTCSPRGRASSPPRAALPELDALAGPALLHVPADLMDPTRPPR